MVKSINFLLDTSLNLSMITNILIFDIPRLRPFNFASTKDHLIRYTDKLFK